MNKLEQIKYLCKVSFNDQVEAISNGKQVYKDRLEAINEIVLDTEDNNLKTLFEIAKIVGNNNLPYTDIFARDRVKEVNNIVKDALGKDIDYSKQRELEF